MEADARRVAPAAGQQQRGAEPSAGLSAAPSAHPAPWLSVVIPMYNEAERLGATLDDALRWLEGPGSTRGACELILVDDGSSDGTLRVARDWRRRSPGIVRIERHERNRGKGAAVRTGLAASLGAWVLMMDADNSARVREVVKLIERGESSGAGLIAGSRGLRSSAVRTRAARRLSGLVFRGALAAMGMGLLRDTQCGFKLYRRDVASMLARLSREEGFVFDLEHLALAQRAAAGIEEVGIAWTHVDGGTIRLGTDGPRMLRDAWALRKRLRGVEVPDLSAAASSGGGSGVASVLEPKMTIADTAIASPESASLEPASPPRDAGADVRTRA
ncbi:MAG: dolichyl-phosphate beta-glucosyltransferase [Planctomycetota bacterium]